MNNESITPEEAKKRVQAWKKTWPRKEKYLSDQKRLIELARNSISGSLNVDFLDRVQMELKVMEDDLAQEKNLTDIFEQHFGRGK